MPTSHFGELKVQRPQTQVLRLGKTFCHSVSLPWYLVTPQPWQVRPLWGQSPEHEGQHWLDSLQAEVWQVCPRAVLSPLLLFVATKSALTLHHLFEICKENLLVKGLGSLIELKGNCSPASHCKEKKQLVFYKCNALFFGFFFFLRQKTLSNLECVTKRAIKIMWTTPKISTFWILLNKEHLDPGGEECRGQNNTHKTKFLKLFLDVGQSDGAINPKMEISPCNVSEHPSIW